jgi:hypothetical protein
MALGPVAFVVGAAVAGGLLSWWAYDRFRAKTKNSRRGRRH